MAEEQLAVGLLLHGCEPIRDVPEAEVRLFSAPLAREEGGEDGPKDSAVSSFSRGRGTLILMEVVAIV